MILKRGKCWQLRLCRYFMISLSRLVSIQHEVEKVMCEASIPNLLALDRWQHLTLSYSERVQGGRMLGSVSED